MTQPEANSQLCDAQIRWRCRRGMRELDILLEGYFDHCFAHSPAGDQGAFIELLSWSDDKLWDLMLGKIQVTDQGLSRVVEKIRKI